MNLMRGIQG